MSGSGRGRGADRAEASIGEYHRVLTFVSLALLGSVAHREPRPNGAAIAPPSLRSGSAGVMLSNQARGRR